MSDANVVVASPIYLFSWLGGSGGGGGKCRKEHPVYGRREREGLRGLGEGCACIIGKSVCFAYCSADVSSKRRNQQVVVWAGTVSDSYASLLVSWSVFVKTFSSGLTMRSRCKCTPTFRGAG